MADPARYRSVDASGRRSPPIYNPGRSSMPVTGSGYNSLYAGDIHAMSASHHEVLPYRDEYRTSAIPVSATTYAVRKEPVARSTGVNDGPRVHRITDHSGSKRPIIVTTKHHPPTQRSGSPSRDPYRSSDEGNYYAQPASSMSRGRGAGHVPFSPTMDDDDIQRLRDRTQHDRIGSRSGDQYRSSRAAPVYPGTHHRSNILDLNDEGYEYTKPSDLARYDLDHDRPHRVRRENLERYYRPTVSISTDLARPYDQSERRPRGPPPTTWGLDRISRGSAAGIYDGAGARMPLPPSAPLAPETRRPNLLDGPRSPTEEHRGTSTSRALSLIPDSPNLDGHYDYKYLDDRGYAEPFQDYFLDDDVNSRGFGIRVDSSGFEEHPRPAEKRYHEDRREYRDDRRGYSGREPKRRPDDDMEIVRVDTEDRERRRHETEDRERRRHHDRGSRMDEDVARDRKDIKYSDDEPDSKREKIGDKVAAGLGLAAASIGLRSAMKGGRDAVRVDEPSPSRRRKEEETDRRRLDEVEARPRANRKEPMLGDEDFEIVEHPQERENVRNGLGTEPLSGSKRHGAGAAPSPREHSSHRDHSSSADEGKAKTRRRPRASSFNPNDTAELAEMKARLAALQLDGAPTKEKESTSRRDPHPAREASQDRRPSVTERRDPDAEASAVAPLDDEKTLDTPSRDERVRVVPPPPDSSSPHDKKPIKGILKPPKAQFPEEQHPVREGVAPHKDDKTKPNVPSGARWTKISRKLVNPDALRIGKERYEVRDEFVIVLRVLSKEEIQAYAAATATLRGTSPLLLPP
ncbi:hypothetical protein BT67DRAFT_347634, partial [Trichocladium antarcticum]